MTMDPTNPDRPRGRDLPEQALTRLGIPPIARQAIA
jgi:hypothetical protein